MTRAGRIRIACFVGSLGAIAPSFADAQPEGKALAEALFQDGRELIATGKIPEACAKFAMSQRIEPKLGTLLNLAACHEAEGKTASAWAEFTEARVQAQRTNQPEREQFAREHLDALSGKLARVRIQSKDGDSITVSIDGVLLDGAVLGTDFPVDPGKHTLVAEAPGKKAWKFELVVPEGPSVTPVDVPALEPAPAEPEQKEGAPVAPSLSVVDQPKPAPEPAVSHTPAIIAFGVGALAVGVGSYYGLRAFSKKHEAEDRCTGRYCEQEGLDLFEEAERSGNVSTVAFGLGLVAIGVGTYLLLNPPRASAAKASRTKNKNRLVIYW